MLLGPPGLPLRYCCAAHPVLEAQASPWLYPCPVLPEGHPGASGGRGTSVTRAQPISWDSTALNDQFHALHSGPPHSFSCGDFQAPGSRKARAWGALGPLPGAGGTDCDTHKLTSTSSNYKPWEHCQISMGTWCQALCWAVQLQAGNTCVCPGLLEGEH